MAKQLSVVCSYCVTQRECMPFCLRSSVGERSGPSHMRAHFQTQTSSAVNPLLPFLDAGPPRNNRSERLERFLQFHRRPSPIPRSHLHRCFPCTSIPSLFPLVSRPFFPSTRLLLRPRNHLQYKRCSPPRRRSTSVYVHLYYTFSTRIAARLRGRDNVKTLAASLARTSSTRLLLHRFLISKTSLVALQCR